MNYTKKEQVLKYTGILFASASINELAVLK